MKTLKVPQEYATIQSAVDAALPGDSIVVEGGTYNEQVTVAKSNIKIIGRRDAELDGQFRLTFGFILSGAVNVMVRGFTIQHYNLDGITCLTGSDNSIMENRLLDNTEFGVSTFTSPRSRITENTISGSGSYGMYLSVSSNGAVEGNRVSSNGSFGIYLTGGTGNNITGNSVYQNNSYGIVSTGSDALIRCNTVNGNQSIGIYVGANSIVENNEVFQNSSTGIYVSGSNSAVSENHVYKNGADGMALYGGSASVQRNKVFKNGANGINIESSLNVVARNNAQGNAIYDILRARPNNSLFDNVCCNSNPPGLCTEPESCWKEETPWIGLK